MTSLTKPEIIFPTGEFWSDEPTLESNLHLRQILLLIECLEWLWQDPFLLYFIYVAAECRL